MTKGDLLNLKDELEEQRRKHSARVPQQSIIRGQETSRDETDTEVLIRAVSAILDHLAEAEREAPK